MSLSFIGEMNNGWSVEIYGLIKQKRVIGSSVNDYRSHVFCCQAYDKKVRWTFLVVLRLVSFVLALLFVLLRQFCRVQVGEYAGVDGFFFAVFFGIFSGILRDVVVEEFYKEAGVDICHGGES